MKRICALVCIPLLALLSLWGCTHHSGGYALLNVPKELDVDAGTLSEDADNLMSVSESTPLLAALPKEDLYIYATDPSVVSGVLVKYDGVLQYFPWRFTARIAKPDLFVSDYNADGKKDIAFTYVYKAGEHAYRESLHVLLREEKGFSDHLYSAETAALEISEHLSVFADEETPDTFTVYLDGRESTFTLPGHGEFVDLYNEEVQDFTLGDEITLRSEPGMVFRDEGLPVFDVLTYTAHIEFANGILTQTKAQIAF